MEDRGLQAIAGTGKSNQFLTQFASRGLELIPPDVSQAEVPTSRPRQQDRRGRLIDSIAGARVTSRKARVHVDSHKVLGTDHELLSTELLFGGLRSRKRPNTQPRVVAKEIPPILEVDQQEMARLAREHTKAKGGRGYRDPPSVKALFDMARFSREAEDWKRAFAERRKEKKNHHERQVQEVAQGNWSEYRGLKKKRAGDWECHFAECQDGDPHKTIHDHLAGIYGDKPPDLSDFEPEGCFEPIRPEELHEAVRQGKRGKSVGEDGTSLELIEGIIAAEGGESAILNWFNDILESGCMPEDWFTALMIILPKVAQPEKPKQLSIRQGAVESPLFFTNLAEWTLEEAARRFSWPREDPLLRGLRITELMFVDDATLWQTSLPDLARRVEQWMTVLRESGLRINLGKCQLYCSPHNRHGGKLVVNGTELVGDNHLNIMGLRFVVNQTTCEAISTLLTRARDKFWGSFHLLGSRASLHGRLRMLERVCGGAGLWCIAAFYPEKNAQQALNSFQLQLVVFMMGLKRGSGEVEPGETKPKNENDGEDYARGGSLRGWPFMMMPLLLYIYLVRAQVPQATAPPGDSEHCQSSPSELGRVQRLTESSTSSSSSMQPTPALSSAESLTTDTERKRTRQLPLHEQPQENWIRMKDDATFEIELLLRQLVQVQEQDIAGEMAWRLLQRLETPREDELEDRCFVSATVQAINVCAKYSLRHRPRGGATIPTEWDDTVTMLEAGVMEAAQARVRNYRRQQAAEEHRRQVLLQRQPPVQNEEEKCKRTRTEKQTKDDVDQDDVSSLVTTGGDTSRTPRTPRRVARSRVTVTESTVWLTPAGAVHEVPHGGAEATFHQEPTTTDEAIDAWLDIFGFVEPPTDSLPTVLPERLQEDIRRMIQGMSTRAIGLLRRSLPLCLNAVQDEEALGQPLGERSEVTTGDSDMVEVTVDESAKGQKGQTSIKGCGINTEEVNQDPVAVRSKGKAEYSKFAEVLLNLLGGHLDFQDIPPNPEETIRQMTLAKHMEEQLWCMYEAGDFGETLATGEIVAVREDTDMGETPQVYMPDSDGEDEEGEALMQTSLTKLLGHQSRTRVVLQGLNFRLSNLGGGDATRRAKALLTRLARHFRIEPGTRGGLPELVQDAEAILAGHIDPDLTQDFGNSEDYAFVEGWWTDLVGALNRDIHLAPLQTIQCLSEREVQEIEHDQESQEQQNMAQAEWEEYMQTKEMDKEKEVEQTPQTLSAGQYQQWEDWAMWDEMQTRPLRKRRLQVEVQCGSSSSSSKTTVTCPLAEWDGRGELNVRLRLLPGEEAQGSRGAAEPPREVDSEATTLPVEGEVREAVEPTVPQPASDPTLPEGAPVALTALDGSAEGSMMEAVAGASLGETLQWGIGTGVEDTLDPVALAEIDAYAEQLRLEYREQARRAEESGPTGFEEFLVAKAEGFLEGAGGAGEEQDDGVGGQNENEKNNRLLAFLEGVLVTSLFFPPGMVHETMNVGEVCASSVTFQFNHPYAARFYRRFFPRVRYTADIGESWVLIKDWARLDMPGDEKGKGEPFEKARQRADLATYFAKLDGDGDGLLTEAELQFLGRNAVNAIAWHDTDGDNAISVEEFRDGFAYWSSITNSAIKATPKEWRKFQLFGTIENLEDIPNSLSKKMRQASLQEELRVRAAKQQRSDWEEEHDHDTNFTEALIRHWQEEVVEWLDKSLGAVRSERTQTKKIQDQIMALLSMPFSTNQSRNLVMIRAFDVAEPIPCSFHYTILRKAVELRSLWNPSVHYSKLPFSKLSRHGRLPHSKLSWLDSLLAWTVEEEVGTQGSAFEDMQLQMREMADRPAKVKARKGVVLHRTKEEIMAKYGAEWLALFEMWRQWGQSAIWVPYEIVKAIYRQGTLKDDTGLEAVRMELAEFVEWSEVAGQDEGKVVEHIMIPKPSLLATCRSCSRSSVQGLGLRV
ncbi:unnamed protein product [Symbiodinium sp. KB8]|nr:unnamed protein product [Symbiodinium sp. KB8]